MEVAQPVSDFGCVDQGLKKGVSIAQDAGKILHTLLCRIGHFLPRCFHTLGLLVVRS
jgi:hypothetical protein